MVDTSGNKNRIKRRDIAYYRQRQKNRVFTALAAFFAEEAEHGNITKKELAQRLGKDPAQITRWLSAPCNFELDTLSDILLAMGAEMDHEIVRFSDLPEAEDLYHLTGTDHRVVICDFGFSPSHDWSYEEPQKPVRSGTDTTQFFFFVSGTHARG